MRPSIWPQISLSGNAVAQNEFIAALIEQLSIPQITGAKWELKNGIANHVTD